MSNTDWNLDGLDGMFFGPGHNASNKGGHGYDVTMSIHGLMSCYSKCN